MTIKEIKDAITHLANDTDLSAESRVSKLEEIERCAADAIEILDGVVEDEEEDDDWANDDYEDSDLEDWDDGDDSEVEVY